MKRKEIDRIVQIIPDSGWVARFRLGAAEEDKPDPLETFDVPIIAWALTETVPWREIDRIYDAVLDRHVEGVMLSAGESDAYPELVSDIGNELVGYFRDKE